MWYSELYWNIIWYKWWNNINKVKIQLSLPKSYTGFTKDDFLISVGYTDKFSIDDLNEKLIGMKIIFILLMIKIYLLMKELL